MKTVQLSLLILWYFSRVSLGFSSESVLDFVGEPKEIIIKFLADPKISSSNKKTLMLNAFLDDLDPEEILSMLVPKINNLQELLAVLKNCDDYEKSEVFYTHSPYGPLAKFLQTVNDILTSNHAGEIRSYLDEYMQETVEFPKFPHSNPRSRLRQIIGELEVWKYLFYELDAKINTVAIASLKANNQIAHFSSNNNKGKNKKNPKRKDKKKSFLPKHKKKQRWLATPTLETCTQSLVIEHLGIIHLVSINEQFLDEDVMINLVKEEFWQQFWTELQNNLELFPFRSSIKKGLFEETIKDAINYVFIASQLAMKITPDLSAYTSDSSDSIDAWTDDKILDFLGNIVIPDSKIPLVQSKLNSIGRLVRCNN